MKYITKYCIALLASALAACTYPFEADIESTSDMLVVEGSITIGSYSNISLSRITSLNGAENNAPYNFEIRLECEDGTKVIALGSNPYQLDSRELNPVKRYRLVLSDNDKGINYLTDWNEVYGAPQVEDFGYKIQDGMLNVTVSLSSQLSPYFSISYDERWEYTSWVTTKYIFNRTSQEITVGDYPYYTCWDQTDFAKSTTLSAEAYIGNKLTDFPVIKLFPTDRKISRLYNIIMKVSLIPEETYRYWQNLDKISNPDGDLFSPIPSSMRGNIFKEGDPKETVLGHISFSASKNLSLYIDNTETDFYTVPISKISYMLRDQHTSGMQSDRWTSLYSMGYWPYDNIVNDNGDVIGYTWVSQECVDCRKQGGSTQKPADWGITE